ncbi:MAG: hypothetical protein K2O18_06115 [Oscillospiraceae bacterium]|nr:hypothetical protein [Oscillospiraceae bacterium]
MASEYWKWKFRDVQPEEKRELTPQEKRKNWWHYHKWHVAAGAVLLAIPCSIAWNALHQIKPDYQIAYVGENALPDDAVTALETELAALGEDLNGDGRVVARVAQYASYSDVEPGTAAAAEVRLMADVMECESYFFLLEDPEQFQKSYRSLCRLDGTLPEEGDYSAAGTYLAWGDCPVLAQMELGDFSYPLMGETVTGSSSELLSRLYIARRGFWTEKSVPQLEGWAALWEKITEGAKV